jgi:hypothetical protein
MKKSDIEQIIATHPDTVFQIRNRGGGAIVTGFSTAKSYGSSKKHTKAQIEFVRDDGTTSWAQLFSLASIVGVRATSVAAHVEAQAAAKAKREADIAAERKRREAKEAARVKARAAVQGRENEIRAALANIVGCKFADVEVNERTGEVTITLMGDVAANIAAERAYCYS